jgi:DNA-directed RNA polymerase sigma subunit (sigma70/sigma32)
MKLSAWELSKLRRNDSRKDFAFYGGDFHEDTPRKDSKYFTYGYYGYVKKLLMEAELQWFLSHKLTTRQERVIRLLYGFDDGRTRSLTDVAYMFQCARSRIAQIRDEAFQQLQRHLAIQEKAVERMLFDLHIYSE